METFLKEFKKVNLYQTSHFKKCNVIFALNNDSMAVKECLNRLGQQKLTDYKTATSKHHALLVYYVVCIKTPA